MRKWQQDLGGDAGEIIQSIASPSDLTGQEAPSAKVSTESASFTMTKFHWCAVVLIGTFILLVTCKPILVQSQDKDRLYEAPRLSLVTVLTLSSLTAFGYLLTLGAD
jgi:hypothetical protein